MDHPLIKGTNSELRRRVIQLLRTAYSVRREGNIIFVCGGNDASHMRTRFSKFCASNHPEIEVFLPEYAMKDYFSSSSSTQFDIADFETLVADLSHAIVLFPEAPGSFAETGYFSAMNRLAAKTVLALDAAWQGSDSFISMGPARKIDKASLFYGTIQTSYSNPDFEDIISRVQRYGFSKYRKTLNLTTFKELTNYEKFCLIQKCFELLAIATLDDILYIFRGLFKSQVSVTNIKQLTSVLVGSRYLQQIGEYGHYFVNKDKESLLQLRSGFNDSLLRLELAELYVSETEFLTILDSSKHAA